MLVSIHVLYVKYFCGDSFCVLSFLLSLAGTRACALSAAHWPLSSVAKPRRSSMLLCPDSFLQHPLFPIHSLLLIQRHVAVLSSATGGSELIHELYARACTPTPLSAEDLVLFEEQAAAPLDGSLDWWMDHLFRQAFGAAACKAARLNALIAPPQLSRPLGPRHHPTSTPPLAASVLPCPLPPFGASKAPVDSMLPVVPPRPPPVFSVAPPPLAVTLVSHQPLKKASPAADSATCVSRQILPKPLMTVDQEPEAWANGSDVLPAMKLLVGNRHPDASIGLDRPERTQLADHKRVVVAVGRLGRDTFRVRYEVNGAGKWRKLSAIRRMSESEASALKKK